MAASLKDIVLGFIGELRANRVPISVAETLDAMNAIAVASIERSRMREALRASLVKDEADNALFDQTFDRCFGPSGMVNEPHRGRDSQIGVSGKAGGEGAGSEQAPRQAVPSASAAKPHSDDPRPVEQDGSRDEETDENESKLTLSSHGAESGEDRESDDAEADSSVSAGPTHREGRPARTQTGLERIRKIIQLPFASYTNLEYEQAREVLSLLKRRLRVRLGRRMRTAARGRIDFRRTIRASIQRGGSFGDLRFRARRPRRIDLLVLTDISGSVRYASNLMLEMVAGARLCFHRVVNLAYIDRLADAEFEQGHLVTSPVLDPYARSDFGRVLAELLVNRAYNLSRATVVVILGDGRNNRRPARSDLLRELRRRTRAIIWLNPEQPERWGTGDSAIRQYGREVDALLCCANLQMLESALGKIV